MKRNHENEINNGFLFVVEEFCVCEEGCDQCRKDILHNEELKEEFWYKFINFVIQNFNGHIEMPDGRTINVRDYDPEYQK